MNKSDIIDFIKKIRENKEFIQYKMNEENVTGNVDGYETPYAFTNDEESEKKKFKKRVENTSAQYGYEIVDERKKKHSIKTESAYKKYANVLNNTAVNEVSYKIYREDNTRTNTTKINQSIKEMNRLMYEIEKIVGHASRLKTEMNVDQRTLWSASRVRLRKISERLNRVNHKINELGA
ncbi:hypothetical protein [Microcystis phage Mel-JY01]